MTERNLIVLSPAERRTELAAILATGFLRLRARVRTRQTDAARREISQPEEPPKSSRI